MKVILTQEPDDNFGVTVVTDTDMDTIWQGLLVDAITTATNHAEEIVAENASAWRDFHDVHIGRESDMDKLGKRLLEMESAEEYFWAFDPASSKWR